MFNDTIRAKYPAKEAERIIEENKRLVTAWMDAFDKRVSASIKWEHSETEYHAACKAEDAAHKAAMAYQAAHT